VSAALRILLVDDSALLLDMARAALEEAGFTVDAKSDIAELDAVQGDDIDLVLMDVQMPELFGDDIAGVLRNLRGFTAPIYLFSSLDDDELDARARRAGIDGFISKRAGVEALVVRVKDILGDA
jgi:DNA-binding response OmpR family regulator